MKSQRLRHSALVTTLLLGGMLLAYPAAGTEPPKGGACGVVGTETIDYPGMLTELNRIAADSGGRVTMHTLPTTTMDGRNLVYAKVGTGPTKYLVWARIHGNEPVGTRPMLEILDRLAKNNPVSTRIREQLTLIAVPIWNPDGSQRDQREGAPIFPNPPVNGRPDGFPSGQDMNRDWISPLDPRLPPAPTVTDASSPFIYPESRAWYDLYATERPQYVQDIHTFGNAPSTRVPVVPGTTEVVEIQIGIAHEDEHVSAAQLLASRQLAQVALDTMRVINRSSPARFALSSPQGSSPRSALRRMIGGGQGYAGNPYQPHAVNGAFFFEVRKGENQAWLERLVYEGTMAVLETLAFGNLASVDPAGFVALPNPVNANCNDV